LEFRNRYARFVQVLSSNLLLRALGLTTELLTVTARDFLDQDFSIKPSIKKRTEPKVGKIEPGKIARASKKKMGWSQNAPEVSQNGSESGASYDYGASPKKR
jgi:hypothetical protein